MMIFCSISTLLCSNRGLLQMKATQRVRKIALLGKLAYPELRLNSSPNPNPTIISITAKPKHMPTSNGILLRKPKFTPDVITIILFGPGVIEEEIANNNTASKASTVFPLSSMVMMSHLLYEFGDLF